MRNTRLFSFVPHSFIMASSRNSLSSSSASSDISFILHTCYDGAVGKHLLFSDRPTPTLITILFQERVPLSHCYQLPGWYQIHAIFISQGHHCMPTSYKHNFNIHTSHFNGMEVKKNKTKQKLKGCVTQQERNFNWSSRQAPGLWQIYSNMILHHVSQQ